MLSPNENIPLDEYNDNNEIKHKLLDSLFQNDLNSFKIILEASETIIDIFKIHDKRNYNCNPFSLLFN